MTPRPSLVAYASVDRVIAKPTRSAVRSQISSIADVASGLPTARFIAVILHTVKNVTHQTLGSMQFALRYPTRRHDK